MRRLLAVVVVFGMGAAGCKHCDRGCEVSAARAAVAATQQRVMEEEALTNLAKFICDPASVPTHTQLTAATVDLSRPCQGGSCSTEIGRRVGEEWKLELVLDPVRLMNLRTI